MTADGSEPWRVAKPYGGYLFWGTWVALADHEPGTELTVEWRAYDTDGEPINPALLPERSRTVTVPPSRTEDEKARDLILEVAGDHFEPSGELLRGVDLLSTHAGAVRAEVTWDYPEANRMIVELAEPGTYSEDDLQTFVGCGQVACGEEGVGDGTRAWVSEPQSVFRVAYTQPDGDIVLVSPDPAPGDYSSLVDDLSLPMVLDFVTDDRLDTPTD